MTRTIINFIFFSIFFGLSMFAKGQSADSPDFVSKELQSRGGLSNFVIKANKGDSVKVAYLGGSITEQNGWRIYSLDWFKQVYPKAKFKEIKAAIGGTGSDFGAFRVKDQVLKYKPDLIFVEFCVNDNGVSPERITRSMEGIVRQIWLDNPNTDICFIYTIMDSYLADVTDGKQPQSVTIMEQVADKYGIPSINFEYEISQRVHQKQLIFTGKSNIENGVMVFSPDGVHPFPDTGQKIYNEVLMRSFNKMAQNNTQQIIPHLLPQPIDSGCFVNTQMIPIDQVQLDSAWKILTVKETPLFAEFSRYFDKVAEAKPETKLNFQFKGKAFGVFDIIGPGSGRLEITVDGAVVDTIMRFDAYCTYWRKHYFVVDLHKEALHNVTIRVLPGAFDKALILSELNHKKKDPEDYEKYNWYAGKILLDGILIPKSK